VSDIAAHREVGEDYAIFADAIDGHAWVGAVEALMEDASDFRRDLVGRIAAYQPLTWAEHVGRARALMEKAATALPSAAGLA
jgi:hypothetical protein